MNLNLNYEGFDAYLIKRMELTDYRQGVKYRFRFPNRFGASVIKHKYSYGYDCDLWELAVLRYGADEDDWDLCYFTDITDDIIGHLTDKEVRELLQRIKDLE